MAEEKPETSQPQALDLTALEMDQLLGLFIGILAAKAWQYMGLRMIPGKEEIEKDLIKAATAIDVIDYMTSKLIPYIPANEADKLKSIIADLQINYARQA